jgi:hypothetical protein
MNKTRLLAIPLVMIFVLACGLTNGISGIATQLPGILTGVPTTIGAVETLSAQQPSGNCSSTPTTGGLGISLETVKTVLQITNQFTFTDGTVNGQTASTVTLASGAAAAFPEIANGFSAQFIGDPCNLGEITVTIPRTDQQATVDQGMAVINILFAAVLPPGAQFPYLAWLTQQYASMQVGGQQQATFGSMQFTLSRSQTAMVLDVLPVK